METRLGRERWGSVGSGSPVRLLLLGLSRNTHLGTDGKGVPVHTHISSTSTGNVWEAGQETPQLQGR